MIIAYIMHGTVQNLDSGLDWTGLDAKMDCNIDGSREWAWLATEVLLLVTGVHTQWSREYTLPPSRELDKFVAVVFLAYAILI